MLQQVKRLSLCHLPVVIHPQKNAFTHSMSTRAALEFSFNVAPRLCYRPSRTKLSYYKRVYNDHAQPAGTLDNVVAGSVTRARSAMDGYEWHAQHREQIFRAIAGSFASISSSVNRISVEIYA